MSLGDGIAAPPPAQCRRERIVEVDVAVVAHGKVAHLQSVAMEVEHGEIAHCPLCLSSLRGKHHIPRVVRKSYDVQVLAAHRHAERFTAILPHRHSRVVGVINPVDVGSHIYHHGLIDRAVVPSQRRLLERPACKGRQGIGEGGVDEQVMVVEPIGLPVVAEGAGTGHHYRILGVERCIKGLAIPFHAAHGKCRRGHQQQPREQLLLE